MDHTQRRSRSGYRREMARVPENCYCILAKPIVGAWPAFGWVDPIHGETAFLTLPASTKRFVQLHKTLILIAAVLGQGEFGVKE